MSLADRPGAGIAAIVTATIGFSTGFPIVKGVDLPAASIVFWRLLLGVAVLGLLALLLHAPRPARWGPVAAAGLAFAGHQLVFVEATQRTSIAMVTLFVALQPLLVSVVSRRTVGEHVPAALLGWACVAVAGVGLVAFTTAGHESRSLAGDALAACNLLLFTTYFLVAKRARLAGTTTLSFGLGFTTVALVAVVPAVVLSGPAVPRTGGDAGLLLVLAVLPGNGHLLVNWAHSRVSAAVSSLILTGIPVLGAVWGRVFFDEPFGIATAVGLACVIAAIEGGRRVELRRARRAATDG